MFTRLFWKDVTERVIATVAQVLLGLLTADGANLLVLDWQATAAVVGTAAAAVVLKSLVAGQVGTTVSPASLAKDSRGI